MQEDENRISHGVMGRKKRTRTDELLDELLKEYGGSSGVTGEDGLLAELTARLVNRALSGELDHHLGYGPGESAPKEQPNRRNGKSEKTVRSRHGQLPVEVPRDRERNIFGDGLNLLTFPAFERLWQRKNEGNCGLACRLHLERRKIAVPKVNKLRPSPISPDFLSV